MMILKFAAAMCASLSLSYVLPLTCAGQNVLKGQITAAVRDGADTMNAIKLKTKAGTGCGGCK